VVKKVEIETIGGLVLLKEGPYLIEETEGSFKVKDGLGYTVFIGYHPNIISVLIN